MAVYLESEFGNWQLPQGESLLGRGAQCQIRLDDLRLSRQHCIVHLEGITLSVHDCGSANGILVNGDRLSEAQLADGDTLITGPFRFTIRFAPTEADPSHVKSTAVHGPSAAPAAEPLPDQGQPHADEGVPTAKGGETGTKERRSSKEFRPSTDRSAKRTVDMDPGTLDGLAMPDSSEDSKPSAALTERRNRRRIASAIEDALSGPRIGQSGEAPPVSTKRGKAGTEELVPSDEGKRYRSDALQPIDVNGNPIPTAKPDKINPVAVEEATAGPRMLAGFADLLFIAALMLLLGLGPVLGSWLWTRQYVDSAGPLAELLALTNAEGLAAAWSQVRAWHLDGSGFYHLMLGAAALGLLAMLLVGLLALVGATTVKGGPLWHRRFGLVIVDNRSGFYPGPGRALWRSICWLLFAPLGWLGPALRGRGLADRLSGCSVHRRSR